MSVEIHSYQEIAGNIITYNDVNYKLDDIPNVFQLQLEIIDEATENAFIQLIQQVKQNPKDKKIDQELRSKMICVANVINQEIGMTRYFTEADADILKAGEGMNFISEDPKFFKPIIAVFQMGCSSLITLRHKTTGKMYNIWIPQRSMFIINDPKFEYQRGIAKRSSDSVMMKGKNVDINRTNRYSMIFRGKK